MSYELDGAVVWPVPPDWSEPVRERLEWLTDVIRARNGRVQKRRLRRAPRRFLEFNVIADEQARRVADALLMDHGGGAWSLPIWPDVQILDAAVPAMASSITCRTAGFDFADDGAALLWRGLNEWALLGVDTVGPAGLTLSSSPLYEWPAGTRLYPVRLARLAEQPEEAGWTDAAGQRAVAMRIDEPCDWPEVLPTTMYRGYPVLERRPDAGEDIASRFGRDLEELDVQTGPVATFDRAGRAFRSGALRWIAHGRDENTALRSLLCGLAGQWASLWVPTWNADLVLTAPVSSGADSISVQWAAYTVAGRMQSNWRDIRIELWNGTVLYRRITDAAEAGATEILDIDAPLGVAVSPADVRVISFLVFGAQESDVVELEHVTDGDGLTITSTRFVGERNDV